MTTNKHFTTMNSAEQTTNRQATSWALFLRVQPGKNARRSGRNSTLAAKLQTVAVAGSGGVQEVVRGAKRGPAIFAWVLKHVLRKQHRCTAETQAQGYGAAF